MSLTVSFKVDDSQVRTLMQIIPGAIRDEMDTAIDNSVKHIKETINRDYRRFGSASPSYLNPSTSGLGFTDRTGSLRASLTTWIEQSLNKTTGYVSAGVDYDKYVELLWSGKYSYMLPATLQEQDYIVDQVESAVFRAIQGMTAL